MGRKRVWEVEKRAGSELWGKEGKREGPSWRRVLSNYRLSGSR